MSLGHEKVEFTKYKGPDVHVRVLSALDEIELRDAISKAEGTKEIMAVQIQAYVCDADGNPTLQSAEAVTDFMKSMRSTALVKVIMAAEKLNELSDESLETAEKN